MTIVFSRLKTSIGEHIVGMDIVKYIDNGVKCPPYTPDLDLCNYFLHYSKDKINKNTFSFLKILKSATESKITHIFPTFLHQAKINP